MTSYSHAAAEQRFLELKVIGQSAERFLAANTGLIQTAQKAVAPFSFKVAPEHHNLQIGGDKIAVLIAERVLKPLCEGHISLAGAETAPKAGIEGAVSETLNHEFGLRLSGLLKPVQPRSLHQLAFLHSLLGWNDQLVIGIGPTGTGKTHIALAAALNQLAEDRVKHVVVTRPHIVMEGEIVTAAARRELEYDDQFEYLEDILCDLVGNQEFRNLVADRKIALIPFGHLRGRTFNDSLIVVDEAQNLTVRKMRMAVTRMGRASRMVVTGDPQRGDLKSDEQSGLLHLVDLVRGTELAKVHQFEGHDVIRNNLVYRLEQLYDRADAGGRAFQ